MKAQVLTGWAGDGLTTATAYKPIITNDYTIRKYTDVTGQDSANLPPDPNLYIIEVEADESVITAIEADNNYQVLFSE